MAVLVTRPHPDSEATANSLRARGLEVMLAPMLRFEPLPFQDDSEARYDAILVTSANAWRAIAPQLRDHRLLKLPLFAVGEHTAAEARDAGFRHVTVAQGHVEGLRDMVVASVKAKHLKKSATLLYLAAADRAGDLASELGGQGFTVVTHTAYRMIPVPDLPREVCDAFMAGGIEAVLHYSRRSARAFIDAARAGGVEISALALPQCCISANVASILRDAGATQVIVAASPDENALFAALDRALRP